MRVALACAFGVSIFILREFCLWLFGILLATFSEMEPETAVDLANPVMSQRFWQFSLVTTITIALIAVLVSSGRLSYAPVTAWMLLLLPWYSLTLLVLICLEAAEDFARMQNKTFHPELADPDI